MSKTNIIFITKKSRKNGFHVRNTYISNYAFTVVGEQN